VRVEVARAIEQMGSNAASLLLRLRATVCVDDPELMGACCAGVLRIEGVRSIAWASRFLTAGDDSAAEAALAIAGTQSREGFEALRECLGTAKDPWFRSVLLSAIALTRQETAVDLLLDCIRKDSVDARPALEALLRSMPSEEIIERIETLVADNPRLRRVLAEQRRASK
jgi:HEAT repeat protein